MASVVSGVIIPLRFSFYLTANRNAVFWLAERRHVQTPYFLYGGSKIWYQFVREYQFQPWCFQILGNSTKIFAKGSLYNTSSLPFHKALCNIATGVRSYIKFYEVKVSDPNFVSFPCSCILYRLSRKERRRKKKLTVLFETQDKVMQSQNLPSSTTIITWFLVQHVVKIKSFAIPDSSRRLLEKQKPHVQ